MTKRDESRSAPNAARGGIPPAPSLRVGLLGGLIGAATFFGANTLLRATGPDEAMAQSTLEERPRGLVSAADQRIEILERLDRINANLDAMRRLMERQARETPGAPERRH